MADISSINLNGNSYNIKDNNAVSKNDIIDIEHGGTGKTTHTSNAILTGNGTSAINNIATKSGAFYATTTNGAALFGTLPIEQGGTEATTAANARANLGVVSNTGDSVTGNYYVTGSVYLENDYASITTTVGITTAMDRIYAIRDKNNLNLGYFRGRQETNGDVSVDIRARRRNNNTNVDNYLQLSVSTDGTRYIHVPESKQWRNALGGNDGIWPISLGGTGATTAANARVNLNAVSKSGDTITGTLQVKSSTIDSTTTKAPSSTEYFAGLGMYDKSNKYLGYLQAVRDKNGSNYLQISARRMVNSANKEAALTLCLDAAGNPTCSLPTITSGTWAGSTIDVAHGGTSVTTYDNLRTKLGFGAMINTEPEAVSVPTGGYATVGSVTVPKGTSLFTAVCYFASNKNGKRQFFFTNSNSATIAGSTFTDTRTAIDGAATILRLVFLITLTKETTYYFRAYQDSGSAINATFKCRQIQIDS